MVTRLLAAAALVVAALPASADSLRCPGGLVSTGDTKLDLLGKCGEPAWIDARLEERSTRRRTAPAVDEEARVSWPVERWSYDLGPELFTGHVELSAGRVVAIERGARGAVPPRAARLAAARCEPSSLRPGDRAAEVLARCGPPAARDRGLLTRAARVRQGPHAVDGAAVEVALDVWLFDFGPRRFTAIVTLEDGVVREVERGSWGYADAR